MANKKSKINTATFPAIAGDVTKSNFSKISKEITETKTPLKTYIGVKAIETVIKEVLSNYDFRNKVKEDYLKISEGSLSKSELFGAEVNTASTLKKMTLAKEYEYSDEIINLQNEIEKLEIELKAKKDLLKSLKLQEINSGVAKEVTSESLIINEDSEYSILDSFDLKITFKN